MDSTTAPPSSASCPTDRGPAVRETAARVAALVDPARRREAARALAAHIGGEDLIVFCPDPEIGTLLPALGFPQTLPAGLSWQALLRESLLRGQAAACLPSPYDGQETSVLAVASAHGAVITFLGGTPQSEAFCDVQHLLPLLAAAFRGERLALTAEAHARVAEEAASRAEALAASLDRVRRELGEALSKANAAAADNARLYEEVRESDRRKDEFLAMLAHELRNPLAPIRNALQILRMEGADPMTLGQVRDMAERQVQHLTRLVDDLLDVSRITSGKIRLQRQPVDISAVIGSAVETSRPLIESRRHELKVTYPPEAVRLNADPTRLAQVLTNLLNNAAKYTEEGGNIWLTAEKEGREVVVVVRDTGVGISADILPKVFDLFTQVDRSLDRSQGGLGIGLTLVRRLVEMHGGIVRAYSPGVGRGSEFVVRLPVMDEVWVPAAPEVGLGEVSPPRRRILVVDDNVDAAESLAMLLRLRGQEVETAHDGQDSLERARSWRPSLILLDIGLPRMDGYEVARRLRHEVGLEGATLVAVTGYGQEEDRELARRAGFDHHLVKPLDSAALQALLAAIPPDGTG